MHPPLKPSIFQRVPEPIVKEYVLFRLPLKSKSSEDLHCWMVEDCLSNNIENPSDKRNLFSLDRKEITLEKDSVLRTKKQCSLDRQLYFTFLFDHSVLKQVTSRWKATCFVLFFLFFVSLNKDGRRRTLRTSYLGRNLHNLQPHRDRFFERTNIFSHRMRFP